MVRVTVKALEQGKFVTDIIKADALGGASVDIYTSVRYVRSADTAHPFAGATKRLNQKGRSRMNPQGVNLRKVSNDKKETQIVVEQVLMEQFNPDLTSLVTPLNTDSYHELLIQSNYPKEKTEQLVNGFRFGFDLGYRGPSNVRLEANNLKFRVGNKMELWNKIMKEVKEGRFAGGFRKPPYDHYIQSPLGMSLFRKLGRYPI